MPGTPSTKQHDRKTVRGFLLWCKENKLTRRFTLPSAQTGQAAPLTHARRVKLLGQILTDADAPLRSRTAAGLLLLYAQPVSRIVRLTIDDVIQDNDQVLIRLGDPPSPVPQPFAALLLDYTAHRANMRTATNPGSTWLFPGRRASQPLRPEYLAKLIHQLGVPTVAGRSAAIRQHVLDMPAPIVADALGYHHVTTAKLAAQAGASWSRYAPGDHSPLQP
jgi:integrase